jgi:hypothetical protein
VGFVISVDESAEQLAGSLRGFDRQQDGQLLLATLERECFAGVQRSAAVASSVEESGDRLSGSLRGFDREQDGQLLLATLERELRLRADRPVLDPREHPSTFPATDGAVVDL